MIWICVGVVAFLALLGAWIAYELKHAPTIDEVGIIQKSQDIV